MNAHKATHFRLVAVHFTAYTPPGVRKILHENFCIMRVERRKNYC